MSTPRERSTGKRTAAKTEGSKPTGPPPGTRSAGRAPVDNPPARSRTGALRLVTVPVPVAIVRDPRAALEQTRRTVRVARSHMPPPERLLYYSGLGALALTGVLEWPVALVAGAGVWVAGRGQRPAVAP